MRGKVSGKRVNKTRQGIKSKSNLQMQDDRDGTVRQAPDPSLTFNALDA